MKEKGIKAILSIILSLFFIYSCSLPKTIKFPNEFSKFGVEIRDSLSSPFHDTIKIDKYSVAILPIVTKKNKVGIYALKRYGSHQIFYYVILYNGKNISIKTIDDKKENLLFLSNNHFSKWQQRKYLRTIRKIKHHNHLVWKSQTF